MIKLLHLEITDTCKSCPYLHYNNEWAEYHCDRLNKQFDFDLHESKYIWEKGIPEWCPLPEYKDGDKF